MLKKNANTAIWCSLLLAVVYNPGSVWDVCPALTWLTPGGTRLCRLFAYVFVDAMRHRQAVAQNQFSYHPSVGSNRWMLKTFRTLNGRRLNAEGTKGRFPVLRICTSSVGREVRLFENAVRCKLSLTKQWPKLATWVQTTVN